MLTRAFSVIESNSITQMLLVQPPLLLLPGMRVLILILWCTIKALPSQRQQLVRLRHMDDIVSHASRCVLALVTCMFNLAITTCPQALFTHA